MILTHISPRTVNYMQLRPMIGRPRRKTSVTSRGGGCLRSAGSCLRFKPLQHENLTLGVIAFMMLRKEPNQNPNPKTRLTKNPNQKSLGPARCFDESDKNPIFWEKHPNLIKQIRFFLTRSPKHPILLTTSKVLPKKNPLALSFFAEHSQKIRLWLDFLQPLLDLFDQF